MLNEGSSEGWIIPQRESLCAVAIVGQEMIEPIDVQGVSLLEVREGHKGRPVKLDNREEETLEGGDEGRRVSETWGSKLKEECFIEDG